MAKRKSIGGSPTPFRLASTAAAAFIVVIALGYAAYQGTGVSDLLTAAVSRSAKPSPKTTMTTVFWVGEEATADNGFITNSMSAWDEAWQLSFGGYDDPESRCGYLPCAFKPRENPFYAALPYNDIGQNGRHKRSARAIPWYSERKSPYDSVMKDSWIEIRRADRVCYAQIEDVGPGEDNDFEFVFGKAQAPKNTFGLRAGLDVSPATAACLGFSGAATTTWKFVRLNDVPVGPWTAVITE